MRFIKENYLIILISLIGLILRIYDLGNESIWYDEAFSENISKNSPIQLINAVFSDGNEANPPFYYILLHFWILIFGNSEFSLRFMSVLFGSASIIAIYALGKQLFNKRLGLFAALLLALSVFHIQFSQEARSYAFTTFMSIISFYSFLKLTERKSFTYTSLYLLSSALIFYSHYYTIFIIAAQNIFCLTLFLLNRKAGEISILNWIFLQLALIVVYIPGLKHLLLIRATVKESFWIKEPTLEQLFHYVTRYSGLVYLVSILILFALISVLGMKRIKGLDRIKTLFKAPENDGQHRGLQSKYKIYLLILWFLIPIVIPIFYSFVATPIFVARYSIIAVPAFYLLVSIGICTIRSRLLLAAAAFIIISLSVPLLLEYYERVRKTQWRELVSELEKNADYGDILVLQPLRGYMPIQYYQTRSDLIIMPLKDEFPALKDLGNRKVWAVVTANRENRKYIRDELGDKYNFELEKNFRGLDLIKLKPK